MLQNNGGIMANTINVKAFEGLLKKATSSYDNSVNKSGVSNQVWLKDYFKSEMPEISEEEADELAKSSIESLKRYEKAQDDYKKAKSNNVSRSAWLNNTILKGGETFSAERFTQYLSEIDSTLARCNEDMINVVTTQAGTINQNPNLDGFIAEQELVNTFNANASLENSNFRARVLQPDAGQTYGKNSVDIAVDDKFWGQKNIQRHQVKFGKDANATASMVNDKNYNNQRILVPKNQTDVVKSKLSKQKTVSDQIKTDDGVSSDALSKRQAKTLQNRAQDGKSLRKKDWSYYKNKQLITNIGKQTMLASVTGAALGASIQVVGDLLNGKDVKSDTVIETAFVTGADSGAKVATTGALVVATRKGMLPIAKNTSAASLGLAGAIIIENAKVLYKLGNGEITSLEAIDRMGEASTIGVASHMGFLYGAEIGATLGSVVPGVGNIVGGIVGAIAGSFIGKAIYNGEKKLAKFKIAIIKNISCAVYRGVKSIVNLINPFK